MDNQQVTIPANYQQQVQELSKRNQSLYVVIGGIKTLAFWSEGAKKWKPYVEVEERQRILYEKLKNGDLKSFKMTESVGYEIGDKACWKVVIEIDDVQYIGSADIFWGSKAPCAIAETSAFGRALGHANLGTIEGLACSADEMQAAGFRSEPPNNQVVEELPPALKELKIRFSKLFHPGKWSALKKHLQIMHNGTIIIDANLKSEHLEAIDKYLQREEEKRAKEVGGSNG